MKMENNIPTLVINANCISCDQCAQVCPENAILHYQNEYSIEIWSCTLCYLCVEICPSDSIVMDLKGSGR